MSTDSQDDLEELSEEFHFTRLTEIVRIHYLNYLEKLLDANVKAFQTNNTEIDLSDRSATFSDYIHKCAELLEEKAIKACRMAQLYQRKMVKIIARVRRSTEMCKLEKMFQKLLDEKQNVIQIKVPKKQMKSEATQTEKCGQTEVRTSKSPDGDYCSLSLQRKIDMFEKQLNANNYHRTKRRRMDAQNQHNWKQHQAKTQANWCKRQKCDSLMMPPSPMRSPHTTNATIKIQTAFLMPPQSPKKDSLPEPEPELELELELPAIKHNSPKIANSDTQSLPDSEDTIALEMARLFGEEDTELDKILGGGDPSPETIEPQTSKILHEIEVQEPLLKQQQLLRHQQLQKTVKQQTVPTKSSLQNIQNATSITVSINSEDFNKSKIQVQNDNAFKSAGILIQPTYLTTPPVQQQQQQQQHQQPMRLHINTDLRKSIWPCELFMQRRRLSEILQRLIDEDFRWCEIIKYKYSVLFGEDSDDEFAACSPTIELDDVLISSCTHRISHWIVKSLMKPLEEGLIGNRFLFKKLAKNLAHRIVMENQYPDEIIIKNVVAEFFCRQQAVMTIDDIDDLTNLPLTSLS